MSLRVNPLQAHRDGNGGRDSVSGLGAGGLGDGRGSLGVPGVSVDAPPPRERRMSLDLPVQLSTMVDQAMGQEIPQLPNDKIGALRSRYAAVFGQDPLEEADPSDKQLTALAWKLDAGLVPYAEFGVWPPLVLVWSGACVSSTTSGRLTERIAQWKWPACEILGHGAVAAMSASRRRL